jgi:nicotinate-nucleotide--dimethylbenzimidazole phosphoribosyltransferase
MGAVNQFTAQAEDISWPDHTAEQAAADGAGQLGDLDDLFRWICGRQGAHPPKPLQRPRLVVFAADHGVAEAGVSRHELGWASQAAAQLRDGRAPVAALADRSGVGIRVVELAASARIDIEDALSEAVVTAALAAGRDCADDEIDAGADLLIVAGIGAGATTAAATLISLLSSIEPTRCVGRGSGIDDAAWMRKASAVRDARLRARPHRADPVELLRVAGDGTGGLLALDLIQAALLLRAGPT